MAQAERTASNIASRPQQAAPKRFQRPSDRGLTAAGGEVDPRLLPAGYVAEWKRHTIIGARDVRNMATVAQYGWVPVPNKMQPHLAMPGADPDAQVTRGGGCDALYMRPAHLNDEAHAEHQRETEEVLHNQIRALKEESKGQLGAGGAGHTFVKRDKVAIPADTQ